MANRTIQAKLAKMKKARRLFPRHMSAEAVTVQRYNGTSPFAMKNRAFDPPDAICMERDVSNRISGIPITDSKPQQFNSLTMAKMHINLDRSREMERVLVGGWHNWRTAGTTYFVRKKIFERPSYRLDLWFYMDKFYFFEEDARRNTHRRSICYASYFAAMVAYEGANGIPKIIWDECIPLSS